MSPGRARLDCDGSGWAGGAHVILLAGGWVLGKGCASGSSQLLLLWGSTRMQCAQYSIERSRDCYIKRTKPTKAKRLEKSPPPERHVRVAVCVRRTRASACDMLPWLLDRGACRLEFKDAYPSTRSNLIRNTLQQASTGDRASFFGGLSNHGATAISSATAAATRARDPRALVPAPAAGPGGRGQDQAQRQEAGEEEGADTLY